MLVLSHVNAFGLLNSLFTYGKVSSYLFFWGGGVHILRVFISILMQKDAEFITDNGIIFGNNYGTNKDLFLFKLELFSNKY